MLRRRYTWAEPEEAETLVALGGDGFMLQTLHHMLDEGCPKPVFGMNRGTVGFLMNEWRLDRLAERIAGAKAIRVAPLEMRATTVCRRDVPACGDQRSLPSARDAADGEDRDPGQRPRGPSGTGLRRRAGGDACRIDRLQSVCARTDIAAAGEDARLDPDQPVPARADGPAPSCPTTRPFASAFWKRRTARFPLSPTSSRCAKSRRSRSASTASAR